MYRLALIVVLAAALTKTPDLDLYEEAAVELKDVDKHQDSRLKKLLASDNPYRRQLALLRYRDLPTLLSRSTVQPLIAVLDDEEKRPIGDCVRLHARARTREILGEGEYEWLARCERDARSNADLAAELLQRLVHVNDARGVLCAEVITLVSQKPQHADRLRPVAGPSCHYPELLKAAQRAPSEAATQQLLRLALQNGARPTEPELAPLLPLMKARERRTRALAALAVLAGAKREAARLPIPGSVAEITAAVDDDRSDEALSDIPLVGDAAAPIGQALVRRLGRRKAINEDATIGALGALRRLPPGGAQALARVLEGRRPEAALRAVAVLEATDARKLRSSVMKAARGRADLSLVLRALRAAEKPLSRQEFTMLERTYTGACLNEPMSYHDNPNETWCSEAEESLADFALEGGFRFAAASGH